MSTKHQRAKKARRGDRSFQSSAAGKGDQDRTTDVEAYRANYDEIDWGRPHPKRMKFDSSIPGIRWVFDWSADQ